MPNYISHSVEVTPLTKTSNPQYSVNMNRERAIEAQ